ncbi:MAG: DUF4350 domain-containing protein [Saprospiraceae bacterium]|nr:DUF4350 domain-containing protein [Saprospiraceae bacterium]
MDRRVFVISGVALIIVLCFYIFLRNDGKTYNWLEHYKTQNKDPYGLYILERLLVTDSTRLDEFSLDKDLTMLDSLEKDHNYIHIDQGLLLDSVQLDRLMNFVNRGNHAFISGKSFPKPIAEQIFIETCEGYGWTDFIFARDSFTTMNLEHPNLADTIGFDYRYFYFHTPRDYDWHYIDPDFFCAENYSPEILGSLDEFFPNFARKKYGEGYFYLHTTPLAFTNIQLLDEQGLAYASKVFSHLGPGETYLDRENGISDLLSRRLNDQESFASDLFSEGPLQFILSQASLKWAWYSLVLMGLMFLLFRTKRRQRIIPILEENRNSSLEFISTIGSLYFLQKDNRRLSDQMGKLFLGYIREHYDLPTSQLDERFEDRLHGKSDIPKSHISKLLTIWKNLESASFVSDNTLAEFHNSLNYFYRHCK